ncbi:MAG: diacylglycerol/polyprenol kinase family protein [Candidatus Woesearchaeota archaeon]
MIGLKKQITKRDNLEARRQTFHLAYGFIVIASLYVIKQEIMAAILGFLIIFGILISLICKKRQIPFISYMLELFGREKETNIMPGKGAITTTTGFFISVLIFSKDIALASIAILTFGDAISTIIGKKLGTTKICNKSLEGTVSGIIVSAIACSFITPLFPAIIASTIGMLSELIDLKFIDDNILIPMLSGITLTLIMV